MLPNKTSLPVQVRLRFWLHWVQCCSIGPNSGGTLYRICTHTTLFQKMQNRDRSPERFEVRTWKNINGLFESPTPWIGGKLVGKPFKMEKGNSYYVKIHGKKTFFLVTRYGSWDLTLYAAKEFQRKENLEKDLIKNRYRTIAPDVIEMELTRGQTTIFDEADLETMKSRVWCAFQPDEEELPWLWYAVTRKIGGSTLQKVHRILYGRRCDHPNGNGNLPTKTPGLDNRRNNLVPGTAVDNNNNLRMNKNNHSGMNGVYFDKKRRRWQATWWENGKHVGRMFSEHKWGAEVAEQKARAVRAAADERTGCRNGKRPKGVDVS